MLPKKEIYAPLCFRHAVDFRCQFNRRLWQHDHYRDHSNQHSSDEQSSDGHAPQRQSADKQPAHSSRWQGRDRLCI
jgi:hypothetical protein